VSALLGFLIFTICISIYLYYRFAARFHSTSRKKELSEKSSEKLFRSKMHDASFFDGENEDYAEVHSRLRTYSGA
jgi:hypothetical protein